jgi:hypothetical protein
VHEAVFPLAPDNEWGVVWEHRKPLSYRRKRSAFASFVARSTNVLCAPSLPVFPYFQQTNLQRCVIDLAQVHGLIAQLRLNRQEASLSSEPGPDEPGVVRLALRFPDGTRKNRCFRGTDTLQVLTLSYPAQ